MTSYTMVCVGFINPGSLGDRLPCRGLAQAGSTQLMGWPKSLKQQAEGGSGDRPEVLAEEERRPLVDYFGPPVRLERSLWTPATSGRPLRSKGLAQALLPTPTPRLRPGFAGTLLTALLRLA